jgi:hypothetical protein
MSPNIRSSASRHRNKGRLIRLTDSQWDFLEKRKRRTGQSVTSQIAELVRRAAVSSHPLT